MRAVDVPHIVTDEMWGCHPLAVRPPPRVVSMDVEITRVAVGVDESIAAATGLLVKRVRVLLVGEIRKVLKKRGSIWDDVTGRGRRGWRVKVRRDVIIITNITAHGVILARSQIVRGYVNVYHGKVHQLIKEEWTRIVQRVGDRAAAEASGA